MTDETFDINKRKRVQQNKKKKTFFLQQHLFVSFKFLLKKDAHIQ